MIKIPYEMVMIEVEKLYQKEFPDDADQEILDHCQYISDYIESCGWKLEDFTEKYIEENLKEFLSTTKIHDMN